MKSPAVRVPRDRGEEARQTLLERDALRTDLRIRSDEGHLLLPVRPGSAVSDLGEPTEAEFDAFDDSGVPERYQDLVDVPPDRRALLPRAFDIVGDIVLVRLPPELEPDGAAIGSALLRFVPHARLVGADHGVHGTDRVRVLTTLAGSGPWRTRHRENGIDMDVDVERAYFSPRLAREHARVAESVRPDELVYDLCCGVGPFALTIARDARVRRVVAVDQNPAAIELLHASLARLASRARVEPREEDVARFLERAEPADRVVLNLPHEGIKYLPSVGRLVRPGGEIHYYEVVERAELERRTMNLVDRLGGPHDWEAVGRHVVHAYAPTADLLSFTFRRAPEAPTP